MEKQKQLEELEALKKTQELAEEEQQPIVRSKRTHFNFARLN